MITDEITAPAKTTMVPAGERSFEPLKNVSRCRTLKLPCEACQCCCHTFLGHHLATLVHHAFDTDNGICNSYHRRAVFGITAARDIAVAAALIHMPATEPIIT